MDSLCLRFLAYDRNCPAKYRKSLWEPMWSWLCQSQACAEMAYLELDNAEKLKLVSDARKYFRVFKRYEIRCDSTGEFRFGQAFAIDMVDYMKGIEDELNRWMVKLKKTVEKEKQEEFARRLAYYQEVSKGVAAASPSAPDIF